jgi:transposase-like protein
MYVYKGTKRAIVLAVLEGRYTVEKAAIIVRVKPETVKRWLKKFGPDVLKGEWNGES